MMTANKLGTEAEIVTQIELDTSKNYFSRS
jgi:hypothetical protein